MQKYPLTRENYIETLQQFRTRMSRRGMRTEADQAITIREDFIQKAARRRSRKVSRFVVIKEALHHVQKMSSFAFSDAEWLLIQDRLDKDTENRRKNEARDGESSEAVREPEAKVEADEEGTVAEKNELAVRCRGDKPDIERDVRWAYDNLFTPGLRPNDEDVPSPGSWSQLMFARKNHSVFMKIAMPMLVKVESEKKASMGEDALTQDEMLRRFKRDVLKL